MSAPPQTSSVVITTKNRKAELAVAIRSAIAQTAAPEVIVIDDGSTDGTADLVRAEFPAVKLHRFEQSQGYIVQRNYAAMQAAGEILFSIDDDAAFSSPRVIEQTLAEFSSPRIGAVAIPYINVNGDRVTRFIAPSPSGVYLVPAFVGTAHAVRRDLFTQLGGYREHLFHQGEETDFCIRLLAAGYGVAIGRSDPIHHFESPKRDSRRQALFGRRNDILFGWHNVPLLDLTARWLRATAGGLSFGWKRHHLWWMTQGLAWGYFSSGKYFGKRSPVDRATYRLFRRLIEAGSLPLSEVESKMNART